MLNGVCGKQIHGHGHFVPGLPAYQGTGVGFSWIRWGMKIADEEGIYCSVASSDGREDVCLSIPAAG